MRDSRAMPAWRSNRRGNLVAAVFAASLLACAGTVPAPAQGVAAPGNSARGSRRARLFYDPRPVAAMGRRPFPLALVRGTVGGRPTRFMVDTGAEAPVVAAWLAREAGLDVVDGQVRGTAMSGPPVRMLRADHPRMALEGWGELPDRPVLVIDLPEVFRALDLGAVVSPQWLATRGEAVVLDLPAGELRSAPYAAAARALGPWGVSLASAGTRICRVGMGSVEGRALIATAVIDGHPIRLEVDTGASWVVANAGSEAGRAVSQRAGNGSATVLSAAGPISMQRFDGAAVQIGDARVRSPVLVFPGARNEACDSEGRVGIEVLRACVLVIGTTRWTGRCGP